MQCSNAYQQLHQKPDKALQTYNTGYTSYFSLAYLELKIDNPLSRMHCIHYASSLYGDEMTGRFNHIEVTSCHDEIKVNEAHVRNPYYKGKNYDPNTNKTKTNKTSAIILATQVTTTRTMETKGTALPRATIKTNQSTYQSH